MSKFMSWNLGAGHKIKALFCVRAGVKQPLRDQLPPPSSKGIPTYITIKMHRSPRKCSFQHSLTHPSPNQLPIERAKAFLRKKYCFLTFFSQLWSYSKER